MSGLHLLAGYRIGRATDVDAATALVDGAVLTYDQASGRFVGRDQAPLPVDAKGDLLVGAADDVLARLPVGGNGQVLTADSAASAGVKWAAASGGGASLGSLAVGTYLRSPTTNPASTVAMGSGQAQFARVHVPAQTPFDRIAVNITVPPGTAGTARLGVFSDVAGLPSALLLDAGTVDILAGGAGVKAIPISLTLQAGVYWLGAQNEHTGTNPTYSAIANNPLLMAASLTTLYSGAFLNRTGAFPATLPAAAAVGTPVINTALRVA